MTTELSPLIYFGKLPARGDFVRSGHSPLLLHTIDRWLTSGVESLAEDARWKLLYDRARPCHFAFVGSRSRLGMVGHLVASKDASGRRFPFITAGVVVIDEPGAYLPRSPIIFETAWTALQASADNALRAEPDSDVLLALNSAGVPLPGLVNGEALTFDAFLRRTRVGDLGAMLARSGPPVSVRQLILAVGLLLQPVPASGVAHLERGMRLPLPGSRNEASLVASLWLELMAGFLDRADFELGLFMPQGRNGDEHLAVGFDGASPRTLHALLDPEFGEEQVFIDCADAAWVEDHVDRSYAVRKLSNYLAQPDMPLAQVVTTFKEAFLGC